MMKIAILSDIHGSLEALEAVFAAADRIGDFDAVWDLGDVVAANPHLHAALCEAAKDGMTARRTA